jgi:acetolactate synthase I/II/III large subunit
MTKLSNYVASYLADRGVDSVFTVSGGGIMHLLDSVGREERLRVVCNFHEQACAIAAEAYSRVRGGVGVCLVTTGPGGANALSALGGAWVDSIPVVVLSGQVRQDLIADYGRLRQLGPQEIDIDSMVRPVTKYSALVRDPKTIRQELDRAFAIAQEGRPGPVWLTIPLDVQGAEIDESTLAGWSASPASAADDTPLRESVTSLIEILRTARRPVLIGGNGIRLDCAERSFERFVDKLKLPVLLTIGAMDLLPEDHPNYQGKFGPLGQRRGNFALQNADVVLSVGASMNVSTTGFNLKGFAPKATKIMVNVDPAEIDKGTVSIDLGIVSTPGRFFAEFERQTAATTLGAPAPWLEACSDWRKRYPPLVDAYFEDTDHVNSYVFVERLSSALTGGEVVVTGNGLDAWSVYQTFKVRRGQRVFTNVNFGAMGWDLPAAVGAAVAHGSNRVVLVTGDGSFQFNVQELLTIGHNRLDVKIFVLNNDGYESIRATQNNFFAGHLVGADPASGVSNPNFRLLAEAYGLGYSYIRTNDDIPSMVSCVLGTDGPVLCEVNLSRTQTRTPKTSSYRNERGELESRPLEDMFPFLPRDEVAANMAISRDE